VGRSSNVSVDRPVDILEGNVVPTPPGVIRGVEVLRGVEVALCGGVGEEVHVGSIWTRFVALGRIGVVGVELGVSLGVDATQLASNRLSPTRRNLILLMVWLSSGYEWLQHTLQAQQVTAF
jgi:hypothetical protein